MVKQLLEIEVTRELLHVLNGCAAVDAGQRIWLKLEPLAGARARLDASEIRFVRTWIDESIKVAAQMAEACDAGTSDPDHQLIVSELEQLRAVRTKLPNATRRGGRSDWVAVSTTQPLLCPGA